MALEKFKLDGRLALITGSSAGIGLALARGLAEAGAQVVINGRSPDKVAEAAAALASAGHTVHEVPFDVTDAAAVESAVADIEQRIWPNVALFFLIVAVVIVAQASAALRVLVRWYGRRGAERRR